MRIPETPPDLSEAFDLHSRMLLQLAKGELHLPESAEYVHWDQLRRMKPPSGFNHQSWWLALKLKRGNRNTVPLTDQNGEAFGYSLVDPIPEQLHRIDRDAAGRIETPEEITNPATRDRYIINSVIEEAFRSSQIEGAVTTRKAAKEMIRTGRRPRNNSERMVFNNFRTIEYIRELRGENFTPQLVLELHRMMTEGTLADEKDGGRLRESDDEIRVEDSEGAIVFVPPSADELPRRLKSMCDFANGRGDQGFFHPVLRAIILHFWLAYDHPFGDGNGRCARALFYWSMLRDDYWLCEFLSISQVVQKSRQQYYRSFLYAETDDNDLTYFLLYHLKVINQAIDGLYLYLQKKAREVVKAERLIRATDSLNHRQRQLLAHALRHPDSHYTIRGHRVSHRVVYQTARSDLVELVDKDLFKSMKRGRALVFFPSSELEKKLEAL